ncbi:MAG TPA: phosphotransferase [Candidatus Binatia bacterium]|nr:phosphotransferase [Candidatus Binatia bacterium]
MSMEIPRADAGEAGPPRQTHLTGLGEVAEAHRFDVAALERYMRDHVAGFPGSLTVRQFLGGQSNPTYLLSAGGQHYVMRRKPPGKLLPSAHAVEREFRVIAALAGTGVPVPRADALCEDPDVIGTAFFIMQFVPGRILSDPALPGLTPDERSRVYDHMNEVLARLHSLDEQALGLADFGRPGNYYTRQIHRWSSQYRASETERIDAMERLMDWLPAHIPVDDRATLVHGDFRLGNMIVHPTEPRLVAVLDWELSTLGHPLADLAYNCLPYRLSPAEFDGFLGEDLVGLGIPTEQAYLAAYCRRTGRDEILDWDFYVAFAMFRLAAIAQGIMGRVIAGTANAPNARERGQRARPLAETGWALVRARYDPA